MFVFFIISFDVHYIAALLALCSSTAYGVSSRYICPQEIEKLLYSFRSVSCRRTLETEGACYWKILPHKMWRLYSDWDYRTRIMSAIT